VASNRVRCLLLSPSLFLFCFCFDSRTATLLMGELSVPPPVFRLDAPPSLADFEVIGSFSYTRPQLFRTPFYAPAGPRYFVLCDSFSVCMVRSLFCFLPSARPILVHTSVVWLQLYFFPTRAPCRWGLSLALSQRRTPS